MPGMTPELYYGNYVAEGDGGCPRAEGLRDSLSVWGSPGPFDANAVSPALLEALGASPGAIAQLVQRRAQQPFHNLGEVAALGIPTDRLEVDGEHLIWNIRATARLRRPGRIAVRSGPVRFRDCQAGVCRRGAGTARSRSGCGCCDFTKTPGRSSRAAPPAPASGVLLP